MPWSGPAGGGGGGGGNTVSVHHVRFDGADQAVADGGTVPLDVLDSAGGLVLNANVITIPEGATASLAGSVGVSNGAGDYIDARWYDVTNAQYIGSVGSTYAPALTFNSHPASVAFAFVDATAGAVDVILRALDSGDTTLVNGSGRTGGTITLVS